MSYLIRPYHSSDMVSYYEICLKTGDSGQDATPLYRDPDILGHYYAGPYAFLEPELCFTLTRSDIPCGYIIGTRDSKVFYERCEKEWFPPLRKRYPLPKDTDISKDAFLRLLIHVGHRVDEDFTDYPAHLHIDLLPSVQGQGFGRRLTEIFIDRLREFSVPGVYLGVGTKNISGIRFYERIGFHRLKETPDVVFFGMRL